LRWTLAAEISDRMAWFLDQCKRASVDNRSYAFDGS